MNEDKLMTIGIVGAFVYALVIMGGTSPWSICAGLFASGVGVASIILLMSLTTTLIGVIRDEMEEPDEDELDEDSMLSDIGKHLDEINALRAEIGR